MSHYLNVPVLTLLWLVHVWLPLFSDCLTLNRCYLLPLSSWALIALLWAPIAVVSSDGRSHTFLTSLPVLWAISFLHSYPYCLPYFGVSQIYELHCLKLLCTCVHVLIAFIDLQRAAYLVRQIVGIRLNPCWLMGLCNPKWKCNLIHLCWPPKYGWGQRVWPLALLLPL